MPGVWGNFAFCSAFHIIQHCLRHLLHNVSFQRLWFSVFLTMHLMFVLFNLPPVDPRLTLNHEKKTNSHCLRLLRTASGRPLWKAIDDDEWELPTEWTWKANWWNVCSSKKSAVLLGYRHRGGSSVRDSWDFLSGYFPLVSQIFPASSHVMKKSKTSEVGSDFLDFPLAQWILGLVNMHKSSSCIIDHFFFDQNFLRETSTGNFTANQRTNITFGPSSGFSAIFSWNIRRSKQHGVRST